MDLLEGCVGGGVKLNLVSMIMAFVVVGVVVGVVVSVALVVRNLLNVRRHDSDVLSLMISSHSLNPPDRMQIISGNRNRDNTVHNYIGITGADPFSKAVRRLQRRCQLVEKF